VKINIPKVVLPVNLGGYAPELEGSCLFVWVNPPRDTLQAYDDLVTELQSKELAQARKTLIDRNEGSEQKAEGSGQKAEQTILAKAFEQVERMLGRKKEQKADGIDVKLLEWYAQIWNCGPEETRWSVAELRELEAQDPSFLSWMIAQTWAVRRDHIERKKKS
jgi:hypothetical protein